MGTKRHMIKRLAFIKVHAQILLTILESIVQHNKEGEGLPCHCMAPNF